MEELQKGLALDIDETLANMALNWTGKMIDLFGNPHNLSAEEIVRQYRYPYLAPFWQMPEVEEWIALQMYTRENYIELSLIENANHMVQKIQEHTTISCYLTLRPEGSKKYTFEWLQKHGFPDLPIIGKPDSIPWEESHQWKAQKLQELFPTVQGIIDDNPSIVQHISPDYQGTIFLYDHIEYDHSTGLNIIPCKTWEKVYETIKKLSEESPSF